MVQRVTLPINIDKSKADKNIKELKDSLRSFIPEGQAVSKALEKIFKDVHFKQLNLAQRRKGIDSITKPFYTSAGGHGFAKTRMAETGVVSPQILKKEFEMGGAYATPGIEKLYTPSYKVNAHRQSMEEWTTGASIVKKESDKKIELAKKVSAKKIKLNKDVAVAEEALAKEARKAQNSDAAHKLNLSKKTSREIITDVHNTEKKMKEANKKIREHFETGFSMHILQIYAAPAIRAVNRAITETITTFAEFDKVYTDFAVKSEEFGTILSRTELYASAAGEAFSATNYAQAAERFAASGIDVTRNVDALQKSLELATIANIGFDESANVVIKTMQAYHIDLEDASRITDTMVNVANASTAELKDLSSWFGYAAQSAYLAGVDIEEFSTILGVLSSTGMKNVGAATRQLFMQFQKEAVRKRFQGQFGLASDEDFRDMDRVIKHLREYAQASDDIKGTARDIGVTIGGKVTAQTALTSLLTAEEKLWIDIGTASQRTGTTAELYTKITDNAWHSMERIKNSLQLIMIQFGEMFAPVLKSISWLLEGFVKGLIAIPAIVKSTFGFIAIVGAASFGALVSAGLMFVGATEIAIGATTLLTSRIAAAESTNVRAGIVFINLKNAVLNYGRALLSTHAVQEKNIEVTARQTTTLNWYSASMTRAKHSMGLFTAAIIGFGIQAHATSKYLFAEARLVNILTSAWMAYHAAKFAGTMFGPIGAGVAAVGVGGATLAIGQQMVSTAEQEYQIKRMGGETPRVFNININNVNGIENTNDFLTEIESLTTESGYTINTV